MKRKVVAVFLLFLFVFTELPVQAASTRVEKYNFKVTELEIAWEGGSPDEYGTPAYSWLLIGKDEMEPDRMRISYSREYSEGEIYLGSYYFSATIPADTLDLRRRWDEPLDLELEIDGTAIFYPAIDKEEEPPPEDPQPFDDHLSLVIHAEPADAIKVMMNSKSRQEAVKNHEMIRGHITDLTVTGIVNGEDFSSVYASLRLLVAKYLTIGSDGVEPPIEGKASAPAPKGPAKGKPVMQNYNQIYMDAFADRMIGEIYEEQRVGVYLMDSTLEFHSEAYTYDPLEEVETIEYFNSFIEDYSWDPADFSDGQFEINAELTGMLTRIVYRWMEETETVTTEEIIRRVTLIFDLTQSGTNRTIVHIAGQDYATKEHSTTIDYSGSATIILDDADPLPAAGYASIRKSKVRMFGE